MNHFFGCLTLLIFHGIKSTKTDIFTSIAEVEELFETESVLINHFEGYLLVQERKIDYLNLKVQEYKIKQFARANITIYVSNPINTYLFVKRLTTDWRYLEELMSYYYRSFSAFLENLAKYIEYPYDDDLDGAAVALIRLQDTYNLETASVAKGELNGVQYSVTMTGFECLELATHLIETGNAVHSILWMEEGVKLLLSKGILTRKGPKNKRGDDNSLNIEVSTIPIKIIEKHPANDTFELRKDRKYEMMCRNELKPTPSQLRPLRCHYVTNNVPFLKIAPLKRETANVSPFIVIYHDVIYDNEIELIKKMAKPRLMSATVKDPETGDLEAALYRISKTATIKTEEDQTIQNIVQRTEDMTGLNMETAEELEVVNYGIGGHYKPHFDFHKKDEYEWEDRSRDTRIATVLFYMSDVEQGGATVFPAIHTTIFPKKGTAAFWYNLYASGEGDNRTRHAACPVLTGSKWVSNKWIHERGQEFRRQCDLVPDHPTYLEE